MQTFQAKQIVLVMMFKAKAEVLKSIKRFEFESYSTQQHNIFQLLTFMVQLFVKNRPHG